MTAVLENICRHSLTGTLAPLSVGTDAARRLAPGFSGLLGFADPQSPDLRGLAGHCRAGEHFYCFGWPGPVPSGWRIEAETPGLQMVWDGRPPEPLDPLPFAWLTPEHLPQMLDLVAATQPGPFGPRNIELGEFVGAFDEGRLVAMAGQRLAAGPLREISAVCTLPGYQGRGLGRRLVEVLIDLHLRRHQTPFLHVMSANLGARRLYEKMGFRARRGVMFRILSVVG